MNTDNEPLPWTCEDCHEAQDAQAIRHCVHAGFLTGWIGPLCDDCYQRRENYDPPDPDVEDFRGGEAAGYQAEQMHDAQRMKR